MNKFDSNLNYCFGREDIFSNNSATQLRNTTPLIIVLVYFELGLLHIYCYVFGVLQSTLMRKLKIRYNVKIRYKVIYFTVFLVS